MAVLCSIAVIISSMVSKIIISDDFAFCYNVKVIIIVFMDNFIFVYNIMLVSNDMFMLDDLLGFIAIKFFYVYVSLFTAILDNTFLKINLSGNRRTVGLRPSASFITSIAKAHIFHVQRICAIQSSFNFIILIRARILHSARGLYPLLL